MAKKIDLEALRAKHLPRASWRDIFNVTGELTPEDIQAMDAYFTRFVTPDDAGKCINCGLVQGGLVSALLGGFKWGLAHGEGYCSRCHYPARVIHRAGPITRMTMILQYHPDDLQYRKDPKENETEA